MAAEVQEDKEAKKKPKYEPKAKKSIQVVRILGTDIDGNKNLIAGLGVVVGVGNNLSNALIFKLGMNKLKKLRDLTDAEIDTIEKAIADPGALKIPTWMFNRRKDIDTGQDKHLHTSDIKFAQKADIDLMGEMKSYKGLRHSRGLKVRGQRTASTGRGKAVVGVIKKKNPAQAAAAGKAEKKK